MAHLDEGTLQAYLDGELPGRDRAAAAEHLLLCAECRRELDGLRRATETLRDALALTDVPAPPASAPAVSGAPRHGGVRGRTLGRAAVLVLLVAAAASATVPGSPLREWIVDAVRPAPDAAPELPARAAEPPESRPSAPAGIALPGVRDVDIVVTGPFDMAIRLVRTEEPRVAVSALGSDRDPLFRMGAGRIEVVGGAGGELRVEVPRTGAAVRLVVDGRRYAVVRDGTVEVLEPGERDGEDVVWK